MKVGWIIERETHVKELNDQILLSQITSGLKIGVTELCWSIRRPAIELVEGILGLLELKWKSPATLLVTFALLPNHTNNVFFVLCAYQQLLLSSLFLRHQHWWRTHQHLVQRRSTPSYHSLHYPSRDNHCRRMGSLSLSICGVSLLGSVIWHS